MSITPQGGFPEQIREAPPKGMVSEEFVRELLKQQEEQGPPRRSGRSGWDTAWDVFFKLFLMFVGFVIGGVVIGEHAATNHPVAQERSAAAASCFSQLAAIQEAEQRWVTVLYEPDQSGQLVMGALAMLLGVPTGVANIVQGLSGPKPRWILKGKLQPQSPQANAQYGWLDRKDGKTEGPFRAEVLK